MKSKTIELVKEAIKKFPKELHNDLVTSWNEAKEAAHSLSSLTDEEIIECKNSILTRVKAIRDLLGKYVSEADVLEENLKTL